MQAPSHGDVAEALEAAYAQASQLVRILSVPPPHAGAAPLHAHALMDGLDELRAMHVRVLVPSKAG